MRYYKSNGCYTYIMTQGQKTNKEDDYFPRLYFLCTMMDPSVFRSCISLIIRWGDYLTSQARTMTSPFSCAERIYSTHKYLPKIQSLPEPWIYVLRNNEYGVIYHRIDHCHYKIFLNYQTIPFLLSLRRKVYKRVKKTNKPHTVTDTVKINTHLLMSSDVFNARIVVSVSKI